MATETLRDPIDGAELKQIILSRVKASLDRDSTLTDDIAYAGFRIDFEIKIAYKRSKTPSTLLWGTAVGGADPVLLGQSEGIEVERVGDEYETDSPNEAREEHNLPIPVMVKTATGNERRKIHINPPTKKESR